MLRGSYVTCVRSMLFFITMFFCICLFGFCECVACDVLVRNVGVFVLKNDYVLSMYSRTEVGKIL